MPKSGVAGVDIHHEWIEAPERARDLMDRAARDGLVEGYLS